MGDKLTILTLAIGVDYRKSLAKALESKRSYAAKHGYNYIEGNEAWWDRTRPIAWSKVPFIIEQLSKLPEGAVIWQSDADVLITNQDLKLEDNVLPLLPEGKDMLLIFDACKHLNSGNILMRNTAWCRDFWRRVNERTEFTYHIWWENMAMIQIIEENAADRAKVEISNQHKRFNAYIMGCDGEPLWQPGDFLVHFAGVYDSSKMSKLIDEIESGKVPRLDMYKP
jgi:hypothetical protein